MNKEIIIIKSNEMGKYTCLKVDQLYFSTSVLKELNKAVQDCFKKSRAEVCLSIHQIGRCFTVSVYQNFSLSGKVSFRREMYFSPLHQTSKKGMLYVNPHWFYGDEKIKQYIRYKYIAKKTLKRLGLKLVCYEATPDTNWNGTFGVVPLNQKKGGTKPLPYIIYIAGNTRFKSVECQSI